MNFPRVRGNGGRRVVGSRHAAEAALLAVAVSATVIGCTEYEPASDTLETVDGRLNAIDPFASGNDWSCLDQANQGPSQRPVSSANAKPASFVLPLIDFVSSMPPVGARGRACAIVDPACTSPVTDYVRASSDGVLALPLFEGFDGFIEVLADGMTNELFFLNAPLAGNTESFPAFLVPEASGRGLIETIGVPFDERFGYIGYWALDCNGDPAEGVLISHDAGGIVYNFVDGVPAFQPITVDGIGGILNVPPGRVLVRGVLSPGGQTIAVRSFIIRGNWISVINLSPSITP